MGDVTRTVLYLVCKSHHREAIFFFLDIISFGAMISFRQTPNTTASAVVTTRRGTTPFPCLHYKVLLSGIVID
ncbi:hypothetical protein L6452_03573 [Arctium lappa]|uniref:Uncharacterized protein n=1 Tax=Arctium lappa TaxID=4217 RepID=A0ACB9FM06_ARCLA|nr:hypothetical protein L6452_03573 [Arctium lappa]